MMKISLSLFLLFALLLSFAFDIDASALKIQDEAFERAMVAFGLAKGLNAVISLVQGTQLAFTPVGIGMTFSVGEILDPFNDMVERFSWVMLFASVSLGIQKLLLILSAKLFLQVLLFISVVLSLFFLWFKELRNTLFLSYSLKAFALLFLLRFGAIIFVYSSEYFYNAILQDEYVQSSSVIVETKNKLEDFQSQNNSVLKNTDEESFFKSINAKYNNLAQSLDISKKLELLSKNIDEAFVKIINLITIFVVESVLMPLLFLWFFVVCVKFLFRYELRFDKKIKI
ncbi:MAG: hypothetical protein PHU40_01740 [Sulfurimonas sp.]|nr:hypothetical protein [Sulfurimonas sp.]